MRAHAGALVLLVTVLAAGCRTSPDAVPPSSGGSSLIVDGARVPVETLVIPWFEPPHYNAYAMEGRFGVAPTGLRYRPGREGPLEESVDLFVLHYDAVGTSRSCFRVLHDQRELSVHFLLDVDGTIYQTLDLADTAWHARHANPRAIGIEIAQKGAYPPEQAAVLEAWYSGAPEDTRLTIPDAFGAAGVRTQAFAGRPARSAPIEGVICGRSLVQYDFTPEQYDALVHLTVALCRTFPRLRPMAPRDAAGEVRRDALSREELDAFGGVIGHSHVTADKVDPGPAFDWERFLRRVRTELGEGVSP